VVSDWNATHTTAKAALAGLDAEQPGGPAERARFGDALKKAVDVGEVPMSRVDDMVHRILRTAFAAGVIDDPPLGVCAAEAGRAQSLPLGHSQLHL
jgi:beta-glucosidase